MAPVGGGRGGVHRPERLRHDLVPGVWRRAQVHRQLPHGELDRGHPEPRRVAGLPLRPVISRCASQPTVACWSMLRIAGEYRTTVPEESPRELDTFQAAACICLNLSFWALGMVYSATVGIV